MNTLTTILTQSKGITAILIAVAVILVLTYLFSKVEKMDDKTKNIYLNRMSNR